jgi:hypothetical protein
MGAAYSTPEAKPDDDGKKMPRKFCEDMPITIYRKNHGIKCINITDVSDGIYKGYSYVNGIMNIGYFIQSDDKFHLLKGLILDEKNKDIITIIKGCRIILIAHTALLIESIRCLSPYGCIVDIKYGDDYEISTSFFDKTLILYNPNHTLINEKNCEIDNALLKKKPMFNKFLRLPIETPNIKDAFIPMISDAEYYSLFDLANEILRKDKNPHNLSPCVICSDNKPVWCFDCGHIIYCQKCYTDNMQKIKMICPLCMGLSENIKKVYY